MKVNISIDDVSPHPNSSIRVVEKCYKVIQHFPEAKFTLFIPMAYWRTVKPGTVTTSALNLDAYPDFVDAIKRLPQENFEICYHGLLHGIPGRSDNDEFQSINEEQAREKFALMFEIAKNAGLMDLFKPVFRPPAWRMSPAAIKVAQEVGIKTLALSPDDYAKQTYSGADAQFPHVVYFNSAPPFKDLSNVQVCEIVYHACEWDKNYLGDELTNQLIQWLKDCEDLEFCFIQDM